jgi:hypothetical protein
MDANDLVQSLLENDDVDPKAFIQSHGQQLDGPSRKHLFVSSTDGGLYDTRNKDWHKGPPIRQNYQRFNPRINNVNEFKSTWRARHMSNYPLAFQMSDGELMCEKCVEDNLRQIINSTKFRHNDGWCVVGVGQCHGGGDDEPEDYHSQCAQCNKNLGEVA